MRLRPGFLKANSSPGSRNASDASTTSAAGRRGDAGGGPGKVREPSRPTLLPPRHSCGNGDSIAISVCNARTSSGTSQTSVASILSSRGTLSPTATDLGSNDGGSRGSGTGIDSHRRRASTAPANPGRGGGGDRDKPASRWGRRRSNAAARAASETMVVEAEAVGLNDQGVSVVARRRDGLGASRAVRSGGGRGTSFGEAIDLDDEQLMQRKRGDGNGVSDEDEDEDGDELEDEHDGDGGVLGKPSLGPWNDGALADQVGVEVFPGGAPGEKSPAGTPVVRCEEEKEDCAVSSEASAKVGVGAVEAAVSVEDGAGDGRRQRSTRSSAVPAAAEAAVVTQDVTSHAQERAKAGMGGQQEAELAAETGVTQLKVGDDDAWWSLRPVEKEDGSTWWSPTPEPGKEDYGGWWFTRKTDANSSDDGSDERRWNSASNFLAQAVSVFSSWKTNPSPDSPPGTDAAAAAAATAAATPTSTTVIAADEDPAVESSSDGTTKEEPGLERSVEGCAAVAAEVRPGQKVGAERQCLLLESSFFCKENRTEELRVVLGNGELRAGFKQFLAQRWCAENLIFVEDVMRYQEAVLRQAGDGDSVAGSVKALSLGKAIEETFLATASPREVNIGECMRMACLDKRARDVELGTASMDTFTPIVLELLALMAHTSLRDFRASPHYATIEACLHLGPRDLRNSGATTSMTRADEKDEAGGEGEEEGEREVSGRRKGKGVRGEDAPLA